MTFYIVEILPRQNCRHFADIFKLILTNESYCILKVFYWQKKNSFQMVLKNVRLVLIYAVSANVLALTA